MYCMHCDQEFESGMFCPICERMLIGEKTFVNSEKNRINQAKWAEDEQKKDRKNEKMNKEKNSYKKTPNISPNVLLAAAQTFVASQVQSVQLMLSCSGIWVIRENASLNV